MPIHVERVNAVVSLVEGELPLSAEQLETIIAAVMERLDERDQDSKEHERLTKMRTDSSPEI